MVANGVKTVSASALAKAGVSLADLTWLKSLRNSPARNTPRYQEKLASLRSVARSAPPGDLVPA